jgi:bacterioferritin-associated ferredoxin
MICVLRLSLRSSRKIIPHHRQGPEHVIICICRGKSEREIERAMDNGAESVRDLQRCGIGDQCGSCHDSIRAMLARSIASDGAVPCPASPSLPAVPAIAMA